MIINRVMSKVPGEDNKLGLLRLHVSTSESEKAEDIQSIIEEIGRDLNTTVEYADEIMSKDGDKTFVVQIRCSDIDALEARVIEQSNCKQDMSIEQEQELLQEYEITIKNALSTIKNAGHLSPSEVADKLWELIDEDMKSKYPLGPLEAAAKCKDTLILHHAIKKCRQAYSSSKVVKKKVKDYIEKNTSSTSSEDEIIDFLIEQLPDEFKTTSDTEYLAYKAVCYQEDKEAKGKPEFTPSLLKDKEVQQDVLDDMKENISNGEPEEVVYRSAIEKGIAVVAKKTGQVFAYPSLGKHVIVTAFDLGMKQTLGDNLYNKRKERKEEKKAIREKELEQEERKVQKELEQQAIEVEQKVQKEPERQDSGKQEEMNKYDSSILRQNQDKKEEDITKKQESSMFEGFLREIRVPLIGLAVNIVILIFGYIVSLVYDAPFGFLKFLLFINTIGWLLGVYKRTGFASEKEEAIVHKCEIILLSISSCLMVVWYMFCVLI